MTFLVPLMLFAWVPFTVALFFSCKAHNAVIISLIGGVLFLPMTGYDLPGVPEYSKYTAIAFGLVLGGRLSGKRQASIFSWKLYDLPMIIWCLCPLATSLSNQLGLYDGMAAVFSQATKWGIPYLAGRIYFTNTQAMRDLCIGIVVGGMLYVPLCLYEVRMSPQLSNVFYGFFPHSFGQHMRYGGFRPVVFMQHGIMVALWMAVSTTVSFWMWRCREIYYVKGVPLAFIVFFLFVTTILCKTAGGWLALIIGCGLYFLYKPGGSTFRLQLLLLVVPLYIIVRLTGLVTSQDVAGMASHIFDEDRVQSLEYRLDAENLYSNKAFQRPFLGWGGYARNRVVDPDTGRVVNKALDSLWLITFSSQGLVGLLSFVVSVLTGPWLVFRYLSKKNGDITPSPHIPIVLSLCVVLFMIDSLMNGMFNSIYVLISGTLVNYYMALINKKAKHGTLESENDNIR